MEANKRYLITSALPYANGPLHLGHICGAYLPADIYVRHLRKQGKDVVWVCGSDEHGAAITLRAKKEGISPRDIIDKYHGIIASAFEQFGISFDIYHRTSSDLHHETAQSFFSVLHDSDGFVRKESEQYYDEEHEQFLADRYITGTCPKCSHPSAYGDQCENCGSSLSPFDLINPISTLSGNTPVKKSTEHWYLPMDQHEEWLSKWLNTGELDGKNQHDPNEWKKHVLGQCRSWVDAGLQPRAMTRDLDWGVKVPLENAEGKVLYVWLDAPIGYISATKQWAKDNGKNWEDYWKSEDTELIHFIGKDNIVFHCIIFPILLKAHGDFILPKNVPANEFLNLEGFKFSTSRNYAVWLHEYLEDFPEKIDELRYVLASILPESKDAEFTWRDYQARVNNELVAILGNFINRAVVLTHKYFNGLVPERNNEIHSETLFQEIEQSIDKSSACVEAFKFREALSEAMNIARIGNKFLADEEPWKVIKEDEAKAKDIIHISLQIAIKCADALTSFLPGTSKKIHGILNLENGQELLAGHALNKAEILFKKIEDEEMEAQIAKLKANKMEEEAEVSTKDNISFEDFSNMDIRVGEIVQAEKIEKADKLLKLSVDLGHEKRTIVSGIAAHYKVEDLAGKKVVVLANLAPKKLRGVESQGMILMAEDTEGNLAFVSPEKEMKTGSEVR
ncbi:MAG: methionine--tRNA ligase [Bacteroidota bacterium]